MRLHQLRMERLLIWELSRVMRQLCLMLRRRRLRLRWRRHSAVHTLEARGPSSELTFWPSIYSYNRSFPTQSKHPIRDLRPNTTICIHFLDDLRRPGVDNTCICDRNERSQLGQCVRSQELCTMALSRKREIGSQRRTKRLSGRRCSRTVAVL